MNPNALWVSNANYDVGLLVTRIRDLFTRDDASLGGRDSTLGTGEALAGKRARGSASPVTSISPRVLRTGFSSMARQDVLPDEPSRRN